MLIVTSINYLVSAHTNCCCFKLLKSVTIYDFAKRADHSIFKKYNVNKVYLIYKSGFGLTLKVVRFIRTALLYPNLAQNIKEAILA